MIIKNYLKHPIRSTVSAFDQHGYLNHLSDKAYLKLIYRVKFGKRLNLKNPQTFNEKLQWLKLFDRNPLYTTMVDKYEVKKYIADRIGEKYIIPSYGVWDAFDEIDFDTLPEQFVLKTTHDSGGVMVCKDKSKFDKEKAKIFLESHLKTNFYLHGREWPYKNVKPRILAEVYMEDATSQELRDYKFFCFNGQVKCFKIDFDRFVRHRANYYDADGKLLQFGEIVCPPDFEKHLDLPEYLSQMKKYAEVLSAGTKFLRVDFYESNGKMYFGELTFFPASGLGRFTDDAWDMKLGSWLSL